MSGGTDAFYVHRDGDAEAAMQLLRARMWLPIASKSRRVTVLKPVKGIFRNATINSTAAFL